MMGDSSQCGSSTVNDSDSCEPNWRYQLAGKLGAGIAATGSYGRTEFVAGIHFLMNQQQFDQLKLVIYPDDWMIQYCELLTIID